MARVCVVKMSEAVAGTVEDIAVSVFSGGRLDSNGTVRGAEDGCSEGVEAAVSGAGVEASSLRELLGGALLWFSCFTR